MPESGGLRALRASTLPGGGDTLGRVDAAREVTDILRRGFEEFARYVNPMIALRAKLAGEPLAVTSATGDGRLVLEDGTPVEDLHGAQAFGHRQPAVTAAVQAYLASDAPSWFPSRVNPFAGRLARRLCERTGYTNAWFACTGTEAVEAALKLARGATGRPRLLSLQGAWHGCTFGSVALMSPGAFRDPFGPHLPGASALPFDDVDALRAELAAGDVAAVVVEPIQLEGGVRTPSPSYVAALCELTEAHGTLLVADEVQSGLGRTGRFLASESWPRRPDAVLLAKALGGGLLPISAMLTRRELWERAYGATFESAEAHNTTFSGNPAACIAALATLELVDDALLSRVRETGASFRRQLAEALSGASLLAGVRGEGLVVGLEVRATDHPWVSFEHLGMPELGGHPTTGLLLCHRLYARGWFTFVCGHDWSVLRLQPRLDIEPGRLAALAADVRAELDRLERLA